MAVPMRLEAPSRGSWKKASDWSASATGCKQHAVLFVMASFSNSVPIPERPVTLRQGKEGSGEGRESKLHVSSLPGWRTFNVITGLEFLLFVWAS